MATIHYKSEVIYHVHQPRKGTTQAVPARKVLQALREVDRALEALLDARSTLYWSSRKITRLEAGRKK